MRRWENAGLNALVSCCTPSEAAMVFCNAMVMSGSFGCRALRGFWEISGMKPCAFEGLGRAHKQQSVQSARHRPDSSKFEQDHPSSCSMKSC
jgi:hypothetical protein